MHKSAEDSKTFSLGNASNLGRSTLCVNEGLFSRLRIENTIESRWTCKNLDSEVVLA